MTNEKFLPMPSGIAADVSGVWLMHSPHFNSMMHSAASGSTQRWSPPRQSPRFFYTTIHPGGVAVVNIHGVMMKNPAIEIGRVSMSTLAAREDIRALAGMDAIKSVLIRIESPGGRSDGTLELVDDIQALAAKKRTVAYLEDIGASAGYWAACGTKEIYCNPLAKVGGIGVYATVADYSEMFDQAGVKVHLLTTGSHKGAGAIGTKVEEHHLEEIQRHVSAIHAFFLDGVSKGRSLSVQTVEQLADGRVHVGHDAVRLGLVDAVKSFDEVLSSMAQDNKRQTQAVKSYADMNWHERQACIAKKQPQKLVPVITAPTATRSASDQWDDAVANLQRVGMSREQALLQANRENPGLRRRMLSETNKTT